MNHEVRPLNFQDFIVRLKVLCLFSRSHCRALISQGHSLDLTVCQGYWQKKTLLPIIIHSVDELRSQIIDICSLQESFNEHLTGHMIRRCVRVNYTLLQLYKQEHAVCLRRKPNSCILMCMHI